MCTWVTAVITARSSAMPSMSRITACPVSRSAGPARHRRPQPARLLRVGRLAQQLVVEQQHRVAADHDRVGGDLGGQRAASTASAFASASAATARCGPDPACAASTASSSMPDTSTCGSMPAARSTASRAGEADASTTLVGRRADRCRPGGCRSSRQPGGPPRARVRGRPMPAVRRVGPTPAAAPPPAAVRQRRRASAASTATTTAASSSSRRAAARWRRVGSRSVAHSGMFPCLRGGRVCRLSASIRSARAIAPRVADGRITWST